MEAGILLFGFGAVLGFLLYSGLRWLIPPIQFVALYAATYLKLAARSLKLFTLSTRLFIAVLLLSTASFLFIETVNVLSLLFFPYKRPPWDPDYLLYAQLTEPLFTQFALGFIVGILWYHQIGYLKSRPPQPEERDRYYRLSLIMAIITVFALFLPYTQRWLSNTTSLEIAHIGKLTFDQRQVSDVSATPLFVGSGASLTQSSQPGQLQTWLDLILGVSNSDNGAQNKGTIERDEEYRKLLKSENKTDKFHEQVLVDQKFFAQLRPALKCLQRYAEVFTDYRLFLVDVRPFIIAMTKVATQTDEDAEVDETSIVNASTDISKQKPLNLAQELIKQISKITSDAGEHLMAVTGEAGGSAECRNAAAKINKPYEIAATLEIAAALGQNRVPYKVMALAYTLSAIGSLDTAVLELRKWILRNEGKADPWHLVRAEIELSLILAKALPGGYSDERYRKIMWKHIRRFQETISLVDLSAWSKACHGKSNEERVLVFNFMTQANNYVRASTKDETITLDVVELAGEIKSVDLDCFAKLEVVSGQPEFWRAEFLTRYGRALLASSYKDVLYGRTGADQRKRLRDLARVDLVQALQLLTPIMKEEERRGGRVDGCSTGRGARAEKECRIAMQAMDVFSLPSWQEIFSDANAALNNIRASDG